MKYMLTSIESHVDYGFGVTAESFLNAAQHLEKDNSYMVSISPQRTMPVHYLYRHSIELFLKSMIMILHTTLKIPYDQSPHDSKPKIMYQNKQNQWVWKEMDKCHFISTLFEYWSYLIGVNRQKIEQMTNSSWDLDPSAPDKATLISLFDDSSTYFRYPVDRDMKFDSKKHSMKRKEVSELFNSARSLEGTHTFVQLFGDSAEIANVYQEDNNELEPVLGASRELAEYLSGMHIKARMELCSGY